MKAELVKTFRFDAAHRLPDLPEGHKCRRLHGHSYRLDVHVTGEVDPATGLVIDFGELKARVEPILEQLDHRCLNDVPGLEQTTAERLAAFIFHRLVDYVPGLSAVALWESDTARCIYRGEP